MKLSLKLVSVLFSLGLSATALSQTVVPPNSEVSKALPLEELRRFSEVFDRIKNSYVEPVDDAKVLEDAIRGMISGLDPHSSYLEPEAFDELREHTSGEFGGVGIEISLEDGFIRVIAPIDDTPAVKAGIKAGDLITRIDDEPVKSMGLDGAISRMRGKPGTEIVLTVLREGEDKPLSIKVVRDVIKVTSIKHKMLGEQYAYLRITQFQGNTGSDLKKTLYEIQEKNASSLQGIVLDLRNNPGGVLQAAVEVVDAFIDKGMIVYTQGRLANADTEFMATEDVVSATVPMVVLINGGSASASEIVAGALQDHKRAVIMGTGSFGKGSVQTILPLTQRRALKLTTARYFTPSGRSIQAQGIQPDVVVEEAELKKVQGRNFPKEKDLSGHLFNGQAEQLKDNELAEAQKGLSQRDYQLYEALNLLKALTIVGKVTAP
ncbi:S41 family peptidase [Neptunomonas japonica]|uniref:Carboxyl-terminal processing protease n=1 Tax=Neptunomonas japonica JAMM 1380 TaxID=1441457 RepID=A0A7R6PLC5_9GAMM|nr:S41 family peptidase [Neptunomonas japonica]BBB31251.1 carboxyl-terminal processing protease [Neptunomonas japonica JAMM 1380]